MGASFSDDLLRVWLLPGFEFRHFFRISLARGNHLTKFNKVSLAIKLGMKIWLEFDVCCFVLVLKIKTKPNRVPSPGFVFVVIEGRRFDFIKLNRFT